MKKLKIMLLSLALFAVVGGALAFKARFLNNYCVSATTGTCPASGLACHTTSFGYDIDTKGTAAFCTGTPNSNGNCTNINCANAASVSLAIDN